MLPFFAVGPRLIVAIAVLYGLLAAASVSVKLATRRSGPTMLLDQINAWWRIFPIVTLVLVAYPFGVVALVCLICALAFVELAPYYPGPRNVYVAGATGAVLGTAALQHESPGVALQVLLALAGILALLMWAKPRPGRLVWLLVTLTLASMCVLIRFSDLPLDAHQRLGWLSYLFILTALNDIAQFVSGKLFGRHKIAPTISPNKTWQGLFGGIAVSTALSLVLGTYLSLAAPTTLVVYGMLLSVGGFLGDLMFSAAKRYLAIKDFSTLIRGHGGILDRVDSLVVTAPLLYLCLTQQ